MTIDQDKKNCVDCEKEGVIRKAHRIMPNGDGVCDEHYRKREGLPALVNTLRTSPPKKESEQIVTAKVNWEVAQVDRDAGKSSKEIADRLGVSVQSVYLHTRSAKTKKRIGGIPEVAEKPRTPKKHGRLTAIAEVQHDFRNQVVAKAHTLDGQFGRVITDLQKQKAEHEQAIRKIDAAIAALMDL